MSEPDGAFVKLRLPRDRLVAWLDSKPSPASAWDDWGSIGGTWYEGGGPKPLAEFPPERYAATIAEADALVASYATVRAAIRDVLDAAEAPEFKRASYDPQTQDFVAGTATYAENLGLFIPFLAVARSGAAFLAEDGHGVAVVHNYIWGSANETVAAVRLGPGKRSEFMKASEASSAAGAFQEIADQMADGSGDGAPPPVIDQLDTLK